MKEPLKEEVKLSASYILYKEHTTSTNELIQLTTKSVSSLHSIQCHRRLAQDKHSEGGRSPPPPCLAYVPCGQSPTVLLRSCAALIRNVSVLLTFCFTVHVSSCQPPLVSDTCGLSSPCPRHQPLLLRPASLP